MKFQAVVRGLYSSLSKSPSRVAATLCCVFALQGCGSSEEDASRIVVGPAKDLMIPNSLQYEKGFVVQVTDEEGNPAPNTTVTVEMVPIAYYKGYYEPADTDDDGTPDDWGIKFTAFCAAEDANHNGVLDDGEDANNNNMLEPTNPATLAQHPEEEPTLAAGSDKLVTDSSGFGYFSVVYPVSEALWSILRITASANVSGTEEREDYEFYLPVAISDVVYPVTPPGGGVSPYGTSDFCTDDG